MIEIILTRTRTNGKAVHGTIALPFRSGTIIEHTLENADYLIPEGTYPLERTWSPKFQKMLPKIKTLYQSWAAGCIRHHKHAKFYYSRKWREGWLPLDEYMDFFNYVME